MKRIKDVILSDKTPMDKNSLWLKDDNLKYFKGVWKNINTSTNNTSDIILDSNKDNDIEYLKKFIKQGETWAKNNSTYISDEDNTAFSFPVLLKTNYWILIPSIAHSINNKTIVFPKSQYVSLLDEDAYAENQILTNKKYIITGNIIIDLNSQYNYYEDTLDIQLDQTSNLLEISIPTSTNEKLSAETLAKIQNKLDLNSSFSCIVNGVIAFCRYDEQNHQQRIIITMSVTNGDPDASDDIELYKNFDLIINWLIDYNTGEILKLNQQMNGPIIDDNTNVGMVQQTSNIPVLPSNATLNTVINAYNTLLTKLQETGIMAKK